MTLFLNLVTDFVFEKIPRRIFCEQVRFSYLLLYKAPSSPGRRTAEITIAHKVRTPVVESPLRGALLRNPLRIFPRTNNPINHNTFGKRSPTGHRYRGIIINSWHYTFRNPLSRNPSPGTFG